jgi:hypothetical protein
MAAESKYTVKYHGFVYMDAPAGVPTPAAVDKACKLLKSNKKTAREIHPLFARGLDTPLDMVVRCGLSCLLSTLLPLASFGP